MKTDMFQFIEQAVEYIHSKNDFIEKVAKEGNKFFYNFLTDDDHFLNSNYLNTEDSIRFDNLD